MLKPIASTNGSNRSGHKIFMQVDGKRVEERVCVKESATERHKLYYACVMCVHMCAVPNYKQGKFGGSYRSNPYSKLK